MSDLSDPIIQALADAKRVVIATHTRPDGDAVGSQLALGLYLAEKGKQVRMINQDPAPYNMEWLPGADRLECYTSGIDQLEAIAEADVLVVVDTNAAHRVGDAADQIKGSGATRILIDHHTEPEHWFDLVRVRESASSTGELIHEILTDWDASAIDADIAACLYTAIMTDTGSFRFSNVTANLHRVVADLIERGNLDSSELHAAVYDKRSLEGLRLLGQVLDTIELHYAGRLGTMVISRRALGDTGASVEEADGFVNMLLSIQGVRVATIFTETERGTKVSFRSKGDDHVHTWAHSFGGGGHRNASGAFLKRGLEETIRAIVDSAPKFVSFAGDDPEHSGSPTDDLSSEDSAYLSALLDNQSRTSNP